MGLGERTDNFDCTRQTGRTSPSSTGPFADHTYGTRQGEFIRVYLRLGERTDNFDCTRQTSSSSTGPFADHTYGTRQGENYIIDIISHFVFACFQ